MSVILSIVLSVFTAFAGISGTSETSTNTVNDTPYAEVIQTYAEEIQSGEDVGVESGKMVEELKEDSLFADLYNDIEEKFGNGYFGIITKWAQAMDEAGNVVAEEDAEEKLENIDFGLKDPTEALEELKSENGISEELFDGLEEEINDTYGDTVNTWINGMEKAADAASEENAEEIISEIDFGVNNVEETIIEKSKEDTLFAKLFSALYGTIEDKYLDRIMNWIDAMELATDYAGQEDAEEKLNSIDFGVDDAIKDFTTVGNISDEELQQAEETENAIVSNYENQ